MKKLRIKDIATYLGGEYIDHTKRNREHDDARQKTWIDSVTIDSRQCTANCIYVAIVGERNDGHDFIESAMENGATLCIIEKKLDTYDLRASYILVDSTVKALGQLAAYYLMQLDVTVIGITGSAGKTTTKDMVAHILSARYQVHKTAGNFNNHIGLPLTVFGIEPWHDIAVLEMGMNHLKEIDYLVSIARPHIGLITNIGTAHIGELGSREAIFQAKMEIRNYMSKEDILILNGDDPYLSQVDETAEVIHYGFENSNDYSIKDFEDLGIAGVCGRIVGPEHLDMKFEMSGLGRHMGYTALMGTLVGRLFGMTADQIQERIATYTGGKMRMEKIPMSHNRIVLNDAYNANPESMKAAIDIVNHTSYGNKIAVIGDMLELGTLSQESHQEIGRFLKDSSFDHVLCFGEETKEIECGQHFESMEDLCRAVIEYFEPDSLLLLKGSRGMRLERVLEAIKNKDEQTDID